VKEKNESKKTTSNELDNCYIDQKMLELNKKMQETDFKGNPIESECSSDLINPVLDNHHYKHFTFTSKNNIFENKNSPHHRQISSIDNLQKIENQNRKNSQKRKHSIKKNIKKLKPLKPLKTMENIGSKMIRHKKAIFLMTNQKNLSTSSTSSNEYDDIQESFLYSEEEGILLSHNASELNRIINYQMNPNINLKKKTAFYRNKFGINSNRRISLNITNSSYKRRSSVSTWKNPNNRKKYKFRDLAFICDQNVKYLKYIQTDLHGIHFISTQSLKEYLVIPYSEIKMIILSEKDVFLMKIILKPKNKIIKKLESNHVILEIPTCRKLVKLLCHKGLGHCILYRKSLEKEGDDLFKNSSLNLFPKGSKQGFLNVYVDDFFNDWKTFYVCLVDKILFLFPVFRKNQYQDYRSSLRKVKIYKMISYNVVKSANKIGLNEKYAFVVKINNEQTQIIFNAFNRSEKKDWLRIL
jgi:hypothetical protein